MAAPKRAATVIVAAPLASQVSGARHDYSILMVKRGPKARFMPNAHVFPGGLVEESDGDNRWEGIFKNSKISSQYPDTDSRIGAVREVFEETGLLLSHPTLRSVLQNSSSSKSAPVIPATLLAQLQEARTKTQKNASYFIEMFQEMQQHNAANGAAPAIDKLYQWSRWVTPVQEKWRYDTMFYVAPLSNASIAPISHQESETTRYDWFTPQEALDKFATGDIKLPPPTWIIMNELASFRRLADLKEAVAKGQRDMVPVQPIINGHENGFYVIMPGDREYNTSGALPAADAPTKTEGPLNRLVVSHGKFTFVNAPQGGDLQRYTADTTSTPTAAL